MGIKSIALGASALVLSTSVNAVVINTLNGVDYQWLELTETQGLSRDAVELRLTDINDDLYGYSYASRQLIEDLFLSYTPWDGTSGFYGGPSIVGAAIQHSNDFGVTYDDPGNGVDSSLVTVDGYSVTFDSSAQSVGLYGLADECGIDKSCTTNNRVWKNVSGSISMAFLDGENGWDSNNPNPDTIASSTSFSLYGSYLYKSTVVPVPAAVWLFSSGLVGLVGVARRKKA